MTERLSLQISETLDRTIGFDDQAVVDAVDCYSAGDSILVEMISMQAFSKSFSSNATK